MPVLGVASDGSANGTAGSSHKVAAATVVGMVLGILCLFGMILVYQLLLPRKRKPSPQLRALAPPRPRPLPCLTRLRAHCTTLLNRLQSRSQDTSSEHGEISSGRHRPLRSFHLVTPERRRRREEMRRKFATSLRLNPNFHKPSYEPNHRPFTSHKQKRYYSRLDDPETKHLVRPDSAVISPWSPFEGHLSQVCTPEICSARRKGAEPGTPPLPSPLHPAYLQSTPLRAGFRQIEDPSITPTKRDSVSALTSPTFVDDEMDVTDTTKSLIEEIQQVLEYTRDWSKEDEQMSSFVIAEDDDMDDTESIYNDV